MKRPKELVCFGPKPPASTLPPVAAAVLLVLRDARGIYKVEGFRSRDAMERIRLLDGGRSRNLKRLKVQAVSGALRRLTNLGLAQRTESGAWRAAR